MIVVRVTIMAEQLIKQIATDELSILLIPVNGKQLILPNVSVAEIVSYSEPKKRQEGPAWLKGWVDWRSQTVPLFSFEEINQETIPAKRGAENSTIRRIAILNGIIDSNKLPFCAMISDGVPRAMRIRPREIASLDADDKGIAELASVVVNGEHAVIPNMDWLQQQLIAVL